MKHTPSTDVIQQLVEEQLLRWNKSIAEKRTSPRPVIRQAPHFRKEAALTDLCLARSALIPLTLSLTM
jgi:hypothetical protein